MRKLYGLIIILFTQQLQAKDSLLLEILNENKRTFSYQKDHFEGAGWEQIVEEVKNNQNILIGEDHFLNEIPLFVSELSKTQHFDNYFCEIDAYSATFIASKLKLASPNDLAQFISEYAYTFSFYALAPEFELLKTLQSGGTKIHGTDQIALTASQLIFSAVKAQTQNQQLKTICETIEKEAADQFQLFSTGQGEPYFFSEPFMEHIETIIALDLNEFEKDVIQKIKLSQTIYSEQSHSLRIQLMKNQLMAQYNNLINTKNLFKYGAMHMAKAESFLTDYDIGNLVHGISESQFKTSLHIMIIGKEGIQGVPFNGMEPQPIDPNSETLKPYHSFLNATNEKWTSFHLPTIYKSMKKNKLDISGETLIRTLKGYDYLIVIPKVTPAVFI